MADTKIEWATKVWNPVTGCSKVSVGCANCYAERIAKRFWGDRKFTDVQCHAERLKSPLYWKKSQRIFVNSMSDLFHEDVSLDFLVDVFAVMAKCPQHIFMILTKRPERMRDIINGQLSNEFVSIFRQKYPHNNPVCIIGNNIWLGVTAENQEMADLRIPVLLSIPATVRFVSVEPMLKPVELNNLARPDKYEEGSFYFDNCLTGFKATKCGGCHDNKNKLDWVIAGPETGSGARPMKREWIESLYEQCKVAGVPFFDKKNTLGLDLKQFPEAPNA